ncbi:sugar ABC transporter ATP-binding protein [Limnochorda sp.]|nr:D-xylose ABC transporter ATP-binding protein [Bacillota bacterium]
MPESGKTLLEIRHVTKAFPGTRALDNVSLDVRPGEILGLCGENGAGKSTLVKIISGVYPYGTYEGELFFRGEPLRLTGTRDSEAKGISIIHQELALVPQLTVAENIFLGGEPAAWGVIRQEAMNAAARRLLERVGLDVPPTVLVGSLGVGQRQMVEIAKALRRDVSLLILDEPTSALNETEVERLMETLRELRRRGVSCIYISHKLDELFEITDRITVLRDGQVVGTARTADLDEDRIIAMMVGRPQSGRYPPKTRRPGPVRMRVRNWSVKHPENPERYVVRDVSFEVRSGEILGIAGLMGSGRTELVQSLFGEYGVEVSGEIEIDGQPCRFRSSRDAIAMGVGLVVEDRRNGGLITMHSVASNVTLPSLPKVSRGPVINRGLELASAAQLVEELSIKVPGLEAAVETLSGGNQQKVSIAKWLMTRPRILMLDEPTRGIDVGTKYQIYEIMDRLAADGMAIVMVSSELPEILGMSDRILVMHEGTVAGILDADEADAEAVMALATMGARSTAAAKNL